jgi:hypothetical protein
MVSFALVMLSLHVRNATTIEERRTGGHTSLPGLEVRRKRELLRLMGILKSMSTPLALTRTNISLTMKPRITFPY